MMRGAALADVWNRQRRDPGAPFLPLVLTPDRLGSSLALMCPKCGPVPVALDPWDSHPEQIVRRVRAVACEHEHPKPKPLTPEQREHVRVRGLHRRGELRLM